VSVLKKYNLTGQEVGELKIDSALLESSANLQMIKDYLVALRANARQWSANTRGRAQVTHSGQKPHPQKGTGKARQGYLGAPQYKGGGRVFGPKPKFDQHVRINKKERQAAIRHLLIEKIQNNRLHVLCCDPLKEPKTKKVAHFLAKRQLEGARVLFLGESFFDPKETDHASPAEKYKNLVTSMRNIPKTGFMLASLLSGYDIAVAHDLIVIEPALDELMVLLGERN
jgi:large subunit ribosomal protein L4